MLQIKLSITWSQYTDTRPTSPSTNLQWHVPGNVITGAPFLKSLVQFDLEKDPWQKRESNPGLSLSRPTPYHKANKAVARNDCITTILASLSAPQLFSCMKVVPHSKSRKPSIKMNWQWTYQKGLAQIQSGWTIRRSSQVWVKSNVKNFYKVKNWSNVDSVMQSPVQSKWEDNGFSDQACQLGKPKKEENYSLMPVSEPTPLPAPARSLKRASPQIPISI